jgi:hypothetical protein
MRKLMTLATVALLTGTTGAVAEDNADLLQPISYGAVTGDAEKDTVAYDTSAPSDLWVRFSDDCIVSGSAPASHAAVVATAPRANPHEGIPSLIR